MLTSGSCRISHHHRLSSLVLRPTSMATHHHHMARPGSCRLGSCVRPQSSRGEVPVVSHCSREREDAQERSSEGPSRALSVAGGVVALGKFDALHVGHRELVIQASRIGTPFLMSFVGMAEVLGWEPRTPIVAKCDRQRVLSSWAPHCGNTIPLEFEVEFSTVRSLSPQQFVEKLAQELRVHGVVAGENYRFGFRAAGDSSALVRLCEEYGIGACIIPSVMDKNQNFIHSDGSNGKERGQVSSTRVRHALAAGDMNYVTELLGRRHRLILSWREESESCIVSKHIISIPKSCALNLSPADGMYGNCFVVTGHEELIPCEVEIDASRLSVRTDETDVRDAVYSRDLRTLNRAKCERAVKMARGSRSRAGPNVLITGTPGTGKTTMARALAESAGLRCISIGDLVKDKKLHTGWDDQFDCFVIDEEKVCDEIEDEIQEGGNVVDYHGCDFFPEEWFDRVIVLQTETSVLYDRLSSRGYSGSKLSNNMECEIFQVLLEEARDCYPEETVSALQNDTVEEMEGHVAALAEWVKNWGS